MTALVLDQHLEEDLIQERRAAGADRLDEVWEGIYVMAPAADPQRQGLGARCYNVLDDVVSADDSGKAHLAVNVSDRQDDWSKNYRVPDVAVILRGSAAVWRGPVCVGGPDFLVEIRSDDDETWGKIPFYEKIAVRELLVIERDPWKLTLLRNVDGQLTDVGCSTPEEPATLRSETVPISFRLATDDAGRIVLEFLHHDGIHRWLVVPESDGAKLVRMP